MSYLMAEGEKPYIIVNICCNGFYIEYMLQYRYTCNSYWDDEHNTTDVHCNRCSLQPLYFIVIPVLYDTLRSQHQQQQRNPHGLCNDDINTVQGTGTPSLISYIAYKLIYYTSTVNYKLSHLWEVLFPFPFSIYRLYTNPFTIRYYKMKKRQNHSIKINQNKN